MKTLKPLVLLALIPLGLASSRAQDGAVQNAGKAASQSPGLANTSAVQDESATATVGPQLGQFYFPIKNIARQWKWQATAEGTLEYQWHVTLPLKGETYEFGFSRYCFNSKRKSVGVFEELLESGQVNIWRKNADGGYSMEQGMTGITVKRRGDGLLIRLTEAALLAKLLAEKPATLRFHSVSAKSPGHSEDVRVTYQ